MAGASQPLGWFSAPYRWLVRVVTLGAIALAIAHALQYQGTVVFVDTAATALALGTIVVLALAALAGVLTEAALARWPDSSADGGDVDVTVSGGLDEPAAGAGGEGTTPGSGDATGRPPGTGATGGSDPPGAAGSDSGAASGSSAGRTTPGDTSSTDASPSAGPGTEHDADSRSEAGSQPPADSQPDTDAEEDGPEDDVDRIPEERTRDPPEPRDDELLGDDDVDERHRTDES